MKMQTLRRLVSALVLGCAVSGAWAAVDVSGVPLEETITVGGMPLKLNGAGYRKRGYFKIDVTALYLQQKYNSLDAVEKAPGVKRMQLAIQQDVTGSQASRYFLIDFEASATPAEFAQLINEVSQIGDIYSALPKIKKGDIVTMDWVPGKGLIATLNGNVLTPHGAASPYMNNELLGRVMLRMYIGGKTPAELHDNLLGLSYSMRDHAPTAASTTAAQATPQAAPAAAKPAVSAH